MHIGVQDRFVLFPFVYILLAQADHDTQRLDVKTVALGLRIDVANVLGDCLLLFLEAFDALDESFKLLLGKTTGGLIVLDGGCGSHEALLARLSGETLAMRRQDSKLGTVRSSVRSAHPQHCTGGVCSVARSVLLTCLFKCRLLLGGRLLLVLGAPLIIR